jgi:hypothetical protein
MPTEKKLYEMTWEEVSANLKIDPHKLTLLRLFWWLLTPTFKAIKEKTRLGKL